MEVDSINPPRTFRVGVNGDVEMKDCGRVSLEADEQVTFLTSDGGEYDLAKKDWGFYATPSLNGRLTSFGLHGVLVKNRESGRYFVMLVEAAKMASFEQYCEVENLVVVAWLDTDERLQDLESKLGSE